MHLLGKIGNSRVHSFSATVSAGSSWRWDTEVDRILEGHGDVLSGREMGTGVQLEALAEHLALLAEQAARSTDRVRQATAGRVPLPNVSSVAPKHSTAAATDDDVLDDSAVFWVGGRGDKGAASGKCRFCPTVLPAGARLCTGCCKFQEDMLKCPGCKFPVPKASRACGIYFCPGEERGRLPLSEADAKDFGERWVRKHAAAQQLRRK